MEQPRTPVALAIAGSDSGGGAGIQADLKAFAAVGVHGTTAITAITVQNTVGVDAIHPVPAGIIVGQVEAVASDIGIDAVKIGMLGNVATVDAVVTALGAVGDVPVVIDPVMVSESGATLLDESAREALIGRLLPLASVVTPNLPEARAILGAGEDVPAIELAAAIRAIGPPVTITAAGPIHPDGAAHGSGCTHSSTLAGLLAIGFPLREAAVEARRRAGEAVAAGLRDIGSGPGPVDALAVATRRPHRPLP